MGVETEGSIEGFDRKEFALQRILDWIDDPGRKPADIAFTAGLERQIAYRFEMLLEKVAGD